MIHIQYRSNLCYHLFERRVSFLSRRVSFLSRRVSFLSRRVSFLSRRVSFLSRRVSFLSRCVSFHSSYFSFLASALQVPVVRLRHDHRLILFIWCQVDQNYNYKARLLKHRLMLVFVINADLNQQRACVYTALEAFHL